ncbi:HEPN domain-containing protein [Micromonospora zamorensis]|uniref:ApeA N-terminal domain 1-containing protein n=1 Tax=Micromonospora zamorensis TaxID=709883 RepID=UPI0033A6B267
MRRVDELGIFWLFGHEGDALSGRLRFDVNDGCTVELVGIFDSKPGDDDSIRIHGWIGSSKVTLENCIPRKNNRGSTGVQKCEYYANQLFIGHHFTEDEFSLQTAVVEISDLDTWVGWRGITDFYGRRGDRNGSSYQMSFEPNQSQEATFNGGRVAIENSWKQEGDGVQEVKFRQWPILKIAYDEPQNFKVVRRDVGAVQNLLSLCIDTPTTMDRLILRRPDIRARLLNGEDAGYEQDIELRVPLLRYVDPAGRKPRHPYQMLLTFDELGGIGRIAHWLETSKLFQTALSSMMSVQHAKQMFAENRFLNVAFAAEAFHRNIYGGAYLEQGEFDALLETLVVNTPDRHRAWLKDKLQHANQSTLRKRMRQLAAKAGEATKPITGNIDQWSFAVAKVRNDLTHLGSIPGRYPGGDLRSLSDSVYAVTRACMLLECGVPLEVLARSAQSESALWLSSRVEAAVSRVRNSR